MLDNRENEATGRGFDAFSQDGGRTGDTGYSGHYSHYGYPVPQYQQPEAAMPEQQAAMPEQQAAMSEQQAAMSNHDAMEQPGVNPYGSEMPYEMGSPYHNGMPEARDISYEENAEGNTENLKRTNKENKRNERNERKQKRAMNRSERGTRKSGFAKKMAEAACAGLIIGVLGGGTFYGINRNILKNSNSQSISQEAATEQTQGSSGNVASQQLANQGGTTSTLLYDVSDIAQKVQPSIVSITTTVKTTVQYWYQQIEQESQGAGSGIIVGKDDKNLYILTNYHVVEGATDIKVGFVDDEIVDATVKGYDSDRDLAVVAVPFSSMKESTTNAITIASIGDSDSVKVGEPAIAIGNALGYGQSVTVGYISALERTIEDTEGKFIQTDAAINPGNSGGALINMNGQVIGVNSIKYVDSTVEGMGFSIPINDAMEICNDIIAGKNEKVYLGIAGVDISKDYAEIYGFPQGIYVKEITSGSPAENAALHSGDIIVEFDGQSVYTMEELKSLISEKNEGDKVEISYYRQSQMGGYKLETVEVTLALGIIQ